MLRKRAHVRTTIRFLKISIHGVLPFARVNVQNMISKSLTLGKASNHNTKPSVNRATEVCSQNGWGKGAKLTERSRKVQTKGVVTLRIQVFVKTLSLKSTISMSKTSERTASSNASWLPNQILTHSFTTRRSHSNGAPVGPTWFWSQHALLVASKEIPNNCSFIMSSSRK